MNYAPTYAPPYAQYAQPYAPQYAMAPYAAPSLAATGLDETPKTDPAKEPGITTADFWKKEGPLRIPRWSWLAGVAALGTIGYGWQAGWFDGSKVSSKRTVTASRRDPGRRKKSTRRHAKKRGHRYDFDF